jgi:hypothetical protein
VVECIESVLRSNPELDFHSGGDLDESKREHIVDGSPEQRYLDPAAAAMGELLGRRRIQRLLVGDHLRTSLFASAPDVDAL